MLGLKECTTTAWLLVLFDNWKDFWGVFLQVVNVGLSWHLVTKCHFIDSQGQGARKLLSTFCSCGELEFSFQHPYDTQHLITPELEANTPVASQDQTLMY